MNTDKTQTAQATTNGASKLNKIAYRDGYLHGRDIEHHLQEENRTIRENNSAATGLLSGITITALVGLIGGTLFFLLTHQNQHSTTPVETVPNISQPQN